MGASNKFTLQMSCAELFSLSFGTGFIGWRFHLADLWPKQWKPMEMGWGSGTTFCTECMYVHISNYGSVFAIE
jgi:hypothetical protein